MSEAEAIIENGIDRLNALCVEMRKLGMNAGADALDHAFAVCLEEYVGRHYARREPGAREISPAQKATD